MTEKKHSPKTVIVSSKELGTNCWLAYRFVEGSRCDRIMRCTYPEKKTCKAVDAEIAHLHKEKREFDQQHHAKLSLLIAQKVVGFKETGK